MEAVATTGSLAEHDDLGRILKLERRPVVICEREKGGARRWDPKAQALVEAMTQKYSRGPRVSCACGDRVALRTDGDGLAVFHQSAHDSLPPPPPVLTTVREFCADNFQHPDVCEIVWNLRRGDKAQLKGLGHRVCLTELNPVQAWIMYELQTAGGVFGLVSAGGGKTAAGILAPLAMPEHRTWALLIKPDQRIHYRKAYLWLREHFKVPSIVFETNDVKGSFIVEDEKAPVLHVIPYSLLSNPRSTTLLEMLNPDAVIADESHLLANKRSARGLRLLRSLAKSGNKVFCAWSGSTIKRSMKDGSHLAAHALGLGSPYPLAPNNVEAWAAVIDPAHVPDTTSATARKLYKNFAPKIQLDEHFLPSFVDSSKVREGHRDHVVETLGVISTRSSSINCSLTISERKLTTEIPESVKKALAQVRSGIRPDGEELAEQMEIAVCARHVGAGYHFYWAFNKSTEEERAPGGLIDQWFAARKAWNKELRTKLIEGAPHLDSPMLCANAAERGWRTPRYQGELPVWPAASWPAWAAIKHKVEPDPRVKWIDDFLAQDAAKWALTPDKDGKFGIVWTQSSAFGKRIAQLAGINYHGGGPDAEANIMAEDGSRSIVASIKAHGTGRDQLQHKFHRQLAAEMIASGDGWEQYLARLARPGQEADTVETEVYGHTFENRDSFLRAVDLAEFIQATTPNQQLLLAADVTFSW